MTGAARLAASYLRGEALGNDYLVFPPGEGWTARPAAVEAVCHRRRGVGSDGILAPGLSSSADHSLRILNPDGSEAERSGNGLRILAAALVATGAQATGRTFTVEVGGDIVGIEVEEEAADGTVLSSVEMGTTEHGPGAVGLAPEALDGEGRLELPGVGWIPVHPVSVGNPHLVVFGESATAYRLEEVGPALATHPALARGANVQLARAEGEGRIRAEVWERGAGWTPASGSSACAVAAAGVAEERLPPGRITVAMPGGELEVTVGSAGEVVLRGPSRIVCRGELEPGFLSALDGSVG